MTSWMDVSFFAYFLSSKQKNKEIKIKSYQLVLSHNIELNLLSSLNLGRPQQSRLHEGKSHEREIASVDAEVKLTQWNR